MNIPALELETFLSQYGKLAFPNRQVLQSALFCWGKDQSRLTILMAGEDGSQVLANADGEVLCRYHRITPLFVTPPTKVSGDIQDLLEQLGCLRSRVPEECYENAQLSLQALAQPSKPPASAYLVLQNGQLGVVDPTGAIIVPPEYNEIDLFAFQHPGDADLFLCRKGKYQLNSMDVFDSFGNCIFRQISSLLPREETILTPAPTGPTLRKVKSLWVTRQTIDRPFPEDADFQSVQNECHRYTLKALHKPGSDGLHLAAIADGPVWKYCAAPDTKALLPLAAVIGNAYGCSAETVISRLPDFRAFQREKTPLSVRLAHITPQTGLSQLGLSIRAHHCLVRIGLQTAGDLLCLTDAAISRLPHSTEEIRREIRELCQALAHYKRP